MPALMPKVRLRAASGHWLVLHASRLAGENAQAQIAVIFEVARPVEIAPLIGQAYDLSKRELEIMQLVVRGLSTAEMVATFGISSNTVQDHLKAIFAKVGVRSRRELVGQLFCPTIPTTYRIGSRFRRQWVVHLDHVTAGRVIAIRVTNEATAGIVIVAVGRGG